MMKSSAWLKLRYLALIFSFSGLVIVFQNCGGEMVPLDGAIESQSLWEVDGSTLPQLLSTPDLAYWTKNGNVTVKASPALGDSFSIIAAVKRGAVGDFVTISSGANSEVAKLSIDGSGNIALIHLSDINNYSYFKTTFPAGKDQILVAASFGTKPEQITVLINGLKIAGTAVKVGSPYDFSYLAKDISVMGATSVLESAAYTTKLTGKELNILSRYIATNTQTLDVVYDPSLTEDDGGGSTDVPTMQFLAAQSIINSNCLSCHGSGSSSGDFSNLTQSQFVQRGLVVPKNIAASKIYYRLNGATAGPGPKTMPQGGALSAGQVQIIADWINSIN